MLTAPPPSPKYVGHKFEKRSRDYKFCNTKPESTGYGSVSNGNRHVWSVGMINGSVVVGTGRISTCSGMTAEVNMYCSYM
jgi:hypothetical protein